MPEEPPQIQLPGSPPLMVRWRRSTRARRLSLRVSRLDGVVTLTLPTRASKASALAFLNERADWLRQTLDGIEGPLPVTLGLHLPVEGVILTLAPGATRHAAIEGATLLVPAARPAAAALAFLRNRARERLTQRVAHHAQALGRPAGTLTLRDTRSRWGSCTAKGDLMFNWRLILAPPPVLDYVAAHEVAHLAQMNHSPAFWAEVARLFPAHLEARRWLKTQGTHLHRFRFGDDA